MHEDFHGPYTVCIYYTLFFQYSRKSAFKSLISLSFNTFNILITIHIELSFDIIKPRTLIQLHAKRFLFIFMAR